jgi:RimJ/RimL family protein N-acetyltransferase
MDPLLIDVPERLETERLVLRCPRPGDGPAVNRAVSDSLEGLRPWMPWAKSAPSVDDSEVYCRRMHAKFLLREDLALLIFERGSDSVGEPVLGVVGLHRIDWSTRCFEIGYWRRAGLGGLGIVSEAVQAIARMAWNRLDARRLEIRMDDDNMPSRRVAERAGFTFEGLLRQNALAFDGSPRSTRIYARVRGVEEADSGSGDRR